MDYRTQVYAYLDAVRRVQGEVLGAFGFGPVECGHRLLATGPGWRLRDYGGPASSPVLPFVEQMPGRDVRVLDHPGEAGIGLQHVAILAGRRAYTRIWPEIAAWIEARA